ncbi:MAG: hypothetical protein PHE15_03025 [Dehalococcoidales bacterium]|nr:hypothetical protein [Dehalococcoidales bacterium]
MKSGTSVLYRLPISFVLAICLFSINTSPALALNVGDYIKIDYSVVFSQDEITGDETFYMQVTGTAVCIADLPLNVTECYTTGYIIARHKETGGEVILNSGYTQTISPFPSHAGETVDDTVEVALNFPGESQAGDYDIYGELIKARVKALLWFTVTSYLPQTQLLGTVSYIPESTATTTTITTQTTTNQTTNTTQTTATTQTTTATQTSITQTTTYETITNTTTQTTTLENSAVFVVFDLRISPDRVDVSDGSDYITITVRVSNSGDAYGICELILQINGKAIEKRQVSISGGEAGDVVFNIPVPEVGTYEIGVNGLTGTLVVIGNHVSTTSQVTKTTSIPVVNITKTTGTTEEPVVTTTVVNTQYHSLAEVDTQQTSDIGQTSTYSGSGITGDDEKSDSHILWWLLFIILGADLGLICVLQLLADRKRKAVINKNNDKTQQDSSEYKIHLE